MSMTSNTNIASVWAKPVLIRMAGSEEEYYWMESKEWADLMNRVKAQSPGKNWTDKRTNAWKYYKWHEPREKKKWLRERNELS